MFNIQTLGSQTLGLLLIGVVLNTVALSDASGAHTSQERCFKGSDYRMFVFVRVLQPVVKGRPMSLVRGFFEKGAVCPTLAGVKGE